MRKVHVTIGKDGSVSIEFEGFEGKTCLEAGTNLNSLLVSLGITLEQTGFEPKPEFQDEPTGEIISTQGTLSQL